MLTPNFDDTGSGAQTPAMGAGRVDGAGKTQSSGAVAPNPHDPQYRMGIGQRILGMANNFLQGMAHRGPVVNTGSGATNGKFALDMDAYRNGTLGQPIARPMMNAVGMKPMASGIMTAAKGAGSLAQLGAPPAEKPYDDKMPEY